MKTEETKEQKTNRAMHTPESKRSLSTPSDILIAEQKQQW